MSDLHDSDLASVKITPAMVEAGVSVLDDLEGVVSKVVLVREVFRAMVRDCPLLTSEILCLARAVDRTSHLLPESALAHGIDLAEEVLLASSNTE